MTREPIEVTRQDRIYCLKASSDYHSELCEECRFYPNCDHMTQDDMTELTIEDLEALEQEQDKAMVEIDLYSVIKQKYIERDVLDKIRAEMLEEMIPHSGTGEEVIQAYADGLKKGLEILDKYKPESEVEDV